MAFLLVLSLVLGLVLGVALSVVVGVALVLIDRLVDGLVDGVALRLVAITMVTLRRGGGRAQGRHKGEGQEDLGRKG